MIFKQLQAYADTSKMTKKVFEIENDRYVTTNSNLKFFEKLASLVHRHYGKNIVVHILPKRMRRHLQTERCPASWLIGSPYWLTAEYLYQTIKQKLPSPNAVTVVTAGRSYYGYAGYETQQRWCRLNVKNSRQDVTYHVIYSHAG